MGAKTAKLILGHFFLVQNINASFAPIHNWEIRRFYVDPDRLFHAYSALIIRENNS